jgi:phage-related tail fiber protein
MNRLIAISKRLIIETIKQGIFMLRGRPADSVAISDTVETQAAFVRDPADSVGMSAEATVDVDFNAADSALFSDTVDTITDFNPLAAGSVGISDSAVPVSTFIRAVSDTMSITDTGYVLRQDYALDPTYFADDYVVGTKQTFD